MRRRTFLKGSIAISTGALLGSGIWNVQPLMIMRTFVDSVDLSGTTIYPFVTYAVSGLGRTIDDYTRLGPRSTIGEGLAIHGEEAHDARDEIVTWLRTIELLPPREPDRHSPPAGTCSAADADAALAGNTNQPEQSADGRPERPDTRRA